MVPDTGIDQYGSVERRSAIVATTGATLEEAECIGRSVRQAKELAKAAKSRKRGLEPTCQWSSDSD